MKLLSPDFRALLGESPVWVPRDVERPELVGGAGAVLLSVDISAPAIVALAADGSVNAKWRTPNKCASTAESHAAICDETASSPASSPVFRSSA